MFNKFATFARTCADETTLEGKFSCAIPTLSKISLILAARAPKKTNQSKETKTLRLSTTGSSKINPNLGRGTRRPWGGSLWQESQQRVSWLAKACRDYANERRFEACIQNRELLYQPSQIRIPTTPSLRRFDWLDLIPISNRNPPPVKSYRSYLIEKWDDLWSLCWEKIKKMGAGDCSGRDRWRLSNIPLDLQATIALKINFPLIFERNWWN